MKTTKFLKVISVLVLVLLIGVALFSPMDAAGAALAVAPLIVQFHEEAEEHLFPDNSFMYASVDDSPFLKGRTVKRGVSGDDPESVTNPTSFPLTVTDRADDENSYDIALHATKPHRLGDVEELELAYDKRSSILSQHASVLNLKAAIEFVHNWSPSLATNIIRTTGEAEAAATPSATGTRKAITKNDFINGVTVLSRMDAADNMFGLVGATQYAQLLKIADFIDYNKTGRADMLAKGIIGEILGVKLYHRSKSGIYTNAATPVKKKIDAAGAATDNEALLIWSANMVYRAFGNHEVYINEHLGQFLGSTLNMSVRAGGTIRKDQKGVVAIVQAAGE